MNGYCQEKHKEWIENNTITREEFYVFLSGSRLLKEYDLYRDIAGGYNKCYVLEKSGSVYELQEYSGYDNNPHKDNIIYFSKPKLLHKSLNQEGDGI